MMKALQVTAAGELELVSLPTPHPAPGEALVRTRVATLCAADLPGFRDPQGRPQLPQVVGHEAAGEIVALGSPSPSLKLGQAVAVQPLHACGGCQACRLGFPHLCRQLEFLGLNRPGCFAEYFVARQDCLLPLPAGLDFAAGALAQPVAAALEALERARLQPGQSLLIVGDGSMGLLVERLASRHALQQVVLVGHHDFRLSLASTSLAINTAVLENPEEALLAASGPDGYDAAILATPALLPARQALRLLRPRGRLVALAAAPGGAQVDLFEVLFNELEVTGACNDGGHLPEALAALADPALHLADLITHRFPLAQYREALALAAKAPHEMVKLAFDFA